MAFDLENIIVSRTKLKRFARQVYLKRWKKLGSRAQNEFQVFYCKHYNKIMHEGELKTHRCKTRLDSITPCEKLWCYDVTVDESAGKRDSDVVNVLKEYHYLSRNNQPYTIK